MVWGGLVSAPVIRCENVGKRLGDEWVLRDVSFELFPGEILGLIGPGGHGKSVLLKLLTGLIKPDTGTVWMNGKSLNTIDADELAGLRSQIGYLFQNNALFDFMTVRENVAFPMVQQGCFYEATIRARVEEQLASVGLTQALEQMPRELSGGMQKRVGLVRAVITEPAITLYDDPTAGLDPVTSSKIFKLIASMQARAATHAAIVVSHDIERMRAICERYLMLYHGQVLFSGTEA